VAVLVTRLILLTGDGLNTVAGFFLSLEGTGMDNGHTGVNSARSRLENHRQHMTRYLDELEYWLNNRKLRDAGRVNIAV